VRRFSTAYLDETRRGMWESREALSPLSLADRNLVLDVGCGTGELSSVLAEESSGMVVGIDRDRRLLQEASVPTVQADATSIPVWDGRAALVVCQALLVNLPDPSAALSEFVRCSSDLVAVIEPDNSAVTVESSVSAESDLAERAREHYIRGVKTNVTLGSVPDLFRETGLTDVQTRRYDHERKIEPPYGETAFEAAKRKATGSRLAQQRDTLLDGGMNVEEYESLRATWREMGREVIEAMQAGEYRRSEVIPFHVTVGQVPEDAS
jgi:SAM-dependent methyltransferase